MFELHPRLAMITESKSTGKDIELARVYYPDKKILGGHVQKLDNIKASSNAFLGPDAIIYDNALLDGNAQVIDCAEIYERAHVIDCAVVGGHAQVFGHAMICDTACVGGNSMIGGRAVIRGKASMHHADIDGDRQYLVVGPIEGCFITFYRWKPPFKDQHEIFVEFDFDRFGDSLKVFESRIEKWENYRLYKSLCELAKTAIML